MSTTSMFEAMGAVYGIMAEAMYPDTVTFRRPTVTKGSAGGNVVSATGNPTEPQNIPVRIRPASGREIQLAGKMVSGAMYMLFVPNNFDDALVDVDATCLAQVAARAGGEEGRAYQVHWIGRSEGIELSMLGSLEE